LKLDNQAEHFIPSEYKGIGCMRYAVLVGSMALLARRSFGLISVVSRPASVYRSPASSLMGSRSVRLLASIQSPSKSDESEPKFHSKFKSTAEAKLFSSLGNSMKPELLTSVAKLGYAKMTDVQVCLNLNALSNQCSSRTLQRLFNISFE